MSTDGSWPTLFDMVALSDEALARLDPLVMNLAVAKDIPGLSGLDIGHYVAQADSWAAEIARKIPAGDANFYRSPQRWQDDLDFARLALMCWYVGEVLRTRYRESQRALKQVLYTDASDLFLCGVMDSRQGTCANMAALHVVLGWRLGWPVSLASVGPHFICRFDDGTKAFNIEATNPGENGTFCAPPDEYYLNEYKLPRRAVECGSDLRKLTPRELLGAFVGLRARHLENVGRNSDAESDYLLARHLFPSNRQLHVAQTNTSVLMSIERFDVDEKGHPTELAEALKGLAGVERWRWSGGSRPGIQFKQSRESSDADDIDAIFAAIGR